MRILWLADVLFDAGLILRPLAGWEQRGKELDPIDGPNGVMWHHTVTAPSRTDSSVDYVLAITGRTDLPPPLCNYSTNRDGTVSVIAAGRANHGGIGSWQGVSGNANWIGDEMKNYGSGDPTSKYYEPWKPKQLESARIAAAAILTQLGKDSSWLCGHKEYATPPGRKVDPHTLDMNTQRSLVAAIMEDNMPLTPEDVQKIVDAVWYRPITDPTTNTPRGAQHHLAQAYRYAYAAAQAVLTPEQLQAIADAVSAEVVEDVADELAGRLAE